MAYALAQSAAGETRVILIAGEAGIGKSRLTSAIVEQSTKAGFVIQQTMCAVYDRALPFAPLIDLLHTIHAQRAFDPASIPPSLHAALATLAPDLYPNQTPGTVASGLEKPLLFRALAAALNPTTIQPASPTVVVIEDLHWSDAATLEFLPDFVQRISMQPLLLVLTYRDDEISDELALMVAALNRLRSVIVQLTPARLTPPGVQQMIATIFGQQQPVRAEFVTAIHSLADGNPFLVEELLQTLVLAGDIYFDRGAWTRKPIDQLRIPRSVAEAVRARTNSLDAQQRQVLQMAAILGRRFAFEHLRELTGLDEAALVTTLKVLVSLRVLVEAGDDDFAFHHALAREAITSELLTRERRPLHQAVADVLERQSGDRLGELAYHCSEAGQWAKAIDYSRRARQQAIALFAAPTAIEHFNRAITAYEHLGIAPAADLYLARGQAHEHLGATGPARIDYEQACERARQSGDAQVECQALLMLGFLWVGQDYVRAGELLQAALDRARGTTDRMLVANTLNRVGNWHLMTDDPTRSMAYHREALLLAEADGDQRAIATTLDLLGIAHIMHGDMVTGAQYYERALSSWNMAHERQWRILTLASYATRSGNALFPTAVCAPAPLDVCS